MKDIKPKTDPIFCFKWLFLLQNVQGLQAKLFSFYCLINLTHNILKEKERNACVLHWKSMNPAPQHPPINLTKLKQQKIPIYGCDSIQNTAFQDFPRSNFTWIQQMSWKYSMVMDRLQMKNVKQKLLYQIFSSRALFFSFFFFSHLVMNLMVSSFSMMHYTFKFSFPISLFCAFPWLWIGFSNPWNYVFKGAFFSLSDIRAGAFECDLNRPLPPSSFSWKIRVTDLTSIFLWK